MSLEPAIALIIGLVVLHQVPGVAPVAGVAFVAAGIGAERGGARLGSAGPGPGLTLRLAAGGSASPEQLRVR